MPRCAVGSIVKTEDGETVGEKEGKRRRDVRRDWRDLKNHRMVIKSRSWRNPKAMIKVWVLFSYAC